MSTMYILYMYAYILAPDFLKDQGHSYPMSFPVLFCATPTVAAQAMMLT